MMPRRAASTTVLRLRRTRPSREERPRGPFVHPGERPPEAGFALVEVLVSAVVAVGMATAFLGLLNSTARTSADQRHRSEAYAIAQEDQARMRAMRIPDLIRVNGSRTVTLNGTPFTVASKGTFINDTTSTASCGAGSSSADYVNISSTVTWPGMGATPPTVIQSIVAPPNGSLDPTHGTLTISAQNAAAGPLSGVGLSGSGAGTFSGSTDAAGCAMFSDQASGNYTLTPTAAGFVDKDGNPPAAQTVSVVAGSTNTVVLQYDRPGTIPVTFKTKVGAALVNSTSDSIVVFNTGLTTARVFGTPGGSRVSSITGTSLFPFTSPYVVYAGACTGNNPNPSGAANPPGAAAIGTVTVPPGGSAPVSVQLPALNLTVWSGTSSSPGSKVTNARVTVKDDNCSIAGNPVKRVYATNSGGALADPGLPWSQYDICVDNGSRYQLANNVVVQNLTSGTTLTVYMSSSAGSLSGTCP